MSDIVNSIIKFRRGWQSGLPETPCGYGSRLENTELQREWIPSVIRRYGIKTIADIGAGDKNWIKHTDLCGAEYTGYDLVPRSPDIVEFDIVNQTAPKADLLICLWVLNHLPYKDCQKALVNLKESGSKYLMMSDRPKYHHGQPPEIIIPYVERLGLNNKHDQLILIDLN